MLDKELLTELVNGYDKSECHSFSLSECKVTLLHIKIDNLGAGYIWVTPNVQAVIYVTLVNGHYLYWSYSTVFKGECHFFLAGTPSHNCKLPQQLYEEVHVC